MIVWVIRPFVIYAHHVSPLLSRLRLQQVKYESLNKTKKRETVRKGETTLSDPFSFDTSARFSRWWRDVIYMAFLMLDFAKVHLLSISISFNDLIAFLRSRCYIYRPNIIYPAIIHELLTVLLSPKLPFFARHVKNCQCHPRKLQSLIGKKITRSENTNE